MPRRLVALVALCVGGLVFTMPAPFRSFGGDALAQTPVPTAEQRLEARKLGAEALQLYAQKRWEEALEKFVAANQVVPAPTLTVRAARCLVELNRLVEASEMYMDTIRVELGPTSPWVHRQARQEAIAERDALAPKIPKLIILVEGEPDRVTVDGLDVPDALIGEERPTDPGAHVVEAIRSDHTARAEVTLERGQRREVVLVMPRLEVDKVPEPPAPEEKETWRTPAFISASALAAVGLGIGISHSFIALGQQGSLSDRCPNDVCPPDAHDDADTYDLFRTTSTIGFIAGAVGAGAAAAIFFTDEGEIEIFASPFTPAMGVRGRF